ncbi:MAG: carboxypeptidase regulatory-like domain-containing protein, partial [Acidobacteria bacterium]|nr:carboxypeptidase regulatory-like domain-containing protein [Acidobacteriota bacterium]
AEVPDIDLAPISGSTAAIAVRVTGCLGMAQITLSSDHGRKQMPVQCIVDTVRFTGLAPGEYEVLAEGEANQQKLAGFTVTQAYGGQRVLTLELTPLPTVHIRMIGGGLAATDAGLLLRRRDAAGDGAIVPLSVNPIQVPPGYWQLAGRPPGGSNAYVASVSFDARGGRRTRPDPDPDWFEFYLDGAVQAYVALSFSPGRVTGRVKGGKEAIGAPVYLVPVTSLTRQRMNGSRTVYAAQDGTYRFEGLAPGSYLVLASLETTEATEEALSGRAQPVTVEEGATVTLDLSLQ